VAGGGGPGMAEQRSASTSMIGSASRQSLFMINFSIDQPRELCAARRRAIRATLSVQPRRARVVSYRTASGVVVGRRARVRGASGSVLPPDFQWSAFNQRKVGESADGWHGGEHGEVRNISIWPQAKARHVLGKSAASI
jgi:hypothetical protein